MSELRVALLIISGGFLAALAWWEWRRPRQAREGVAGHRQRPREPEMPAPPPPTRSATDGTLVLPEIRAHEPLVRRDLPVVEMRPETAAPVAPAPAPAPLEERVAAPVVPAHTGALLEPDTGNDVDDDDELGAEDEPGAEDELEAEGDLDSEDPLEADDALERDQVVERGHALEARDTPDAGGEPAPAAAADEAVTARPAWSEELPRLAAAPAPVVEWPPDEERRIVSLRLVATSPERFGGRSLRQALAAEGFVLGRFAIFHKPDEEQRAVLSAASLTRPGTFDADTMDSQRFGGLSLFAVLPGPRPPAQAFEDLISTARNLNERLQGALQDERGSPLTLTRIALLRERVVSGADGALS
jgi:cell division protein ZipA